MTRQTSMAAQNVADSQMGHHKILFGMGVLFIGTLIHTVGTVTRGWIVGPDELYSYGLFNFNHNSDGSLMTVRTFTVLAIVMGVLSVVLTLAYLKMTVFSSRRKMSTLILVVGIGAAGTSLIGAMVFALEFYFLLSVTHANYSFVLCIVGGVLLAAGSVLTFLATRQHMRGSIVPRRRFLSTQDVPDHVIQQISYPVQDGSGGHVWHTHVYTEPPPAYSQLEMSSLPPMKEEPQQMMFDVSPPSYSEAVKWYPKT